MSLSINLPTISEMIEAKKDNDKLSYTIAKAAWGLVILIFVFGIIRLFGCKWAFVASCVCLLLTGIALAIFNNTRVSFKCKKEEKDKIESENRKMIINKKANEIKEAFKEWIGKEYEKRFKQAKGIQMEYSGPTHEPHQMKPNEWYEKVEPLEIKFGDLKKVYPENEADKEIDQDLRKRVFDILEDEEILEVKEKYKTYIFINSAKHPELFKMYNIKHRI